MNSVAPFQDNDVVGLLRPAIDVHTLGVSYAAALIEDCGYRAVIGDEAMADVLNHLEQPAHVDRLLTWLRENRITRLGLSYRLDPAQGADLFGHLLHLLREHRLLVEQGGPLRAVYFAGLPPACVLVRARFGDLVRTFQWDPLESTCRHASLSIL